MDCCNSGSLQSSSGGEQELHEFSSSRTTVFPSTLFFNSSVSSPAINFSNATHQNPCCSSPLIFDSISNFFENFDSSSTSPVPSTTTATPTWLTPLPPPPQQSSRIASSCSGDLQQSQVSKQQQQERTSKKRTRASRRAPTTVLTTDTTNFRAMVQEFTGIPTPPFAAALNSSSSFSRPRLDLFAAAAVPPFLLRPLPQKQLAPFANSLPSNTTTTTADANNITINASSRNPSSSNLQQQQEIFNNNNNLLSLQSLLQQQSARSFSSRAQEQARDDHHDRYSAANCSASTSEQHLRRGVSVLSEVPVLPPEHHGEEERAANAGNTSAGVGDEVQRGSSSGGILEQWIISSVSSDQWRDQ